METTNTEKSITNHDELNNYATKAKQQRLEKENTIRHRKRQSVASACFVVALLLFAFSIGLHRAAFQAYLRTKGKSHDCAEALMEKTNPMTAPKRN